MLSSDLVSLLQWLDQHSAHVKHVDVEYGSSKLEIMVGALQSRHSRLETVQWLQHHQLRSSTWM